MLSVDSYFSFLFILMYDLERKYVETLQKTKAFLDRIHEYEKMDQALLDGSQKNLIFSCFESLYQFHVSFYDDLLRKRLQGLYYLVFIEINISTEPRLEQTISY